MARVSKELREDKSRVVFTVDKGLAALVLDIQDYIDKAQDLLTDKDTCRLITGDPTTKHKNKLV